MSPSPRADTPTNADPPRERACRRAVFQHVDGGQARERSGWAAEADEQAAVGGERDLTVVGPHGRPPRRGVGDDESLHGEARADGRERQARVELAPELDKLGHPPESPVRVRRGVQEARGGGSALELDEAAEDPGRPVHPRHHTGRWRARETDRPERAGTVDGPVEGEGIAGHERAPRERGGERRVPGRQGRRPAGRHRRRPAGPGAHLTRRIGLREEHVEPDGDRPQAPGPGPGGRRPGRGATASAPPRSGSARRSRRLSRVPTAGAPRTSQGADRRPRGRAGPESSGRRRWSTITRDPSPRYAARSRRGDGAPAPAGAQDHCTILPQPTGD